MEMAIEHVLDAYREWKDNDSFPVLEIDVAGRPAYIVPFVEDSDELEITSPAKTSDKVPDLVNYRIPNSAFYIGIDPRWLEEKRCQSDSSTILLLDPYCTEFVELKL